MSERVSDGGGGGREGGNELRIRFDSRRTTRCGQVAVRCNNITMVT